MAKISKAIIIVINVQNTGGKIFELIIVVNPDKIYALRNINNAATIMIGKRLNLLFIN
ncbi:hypothetical protein GCM10008119_08350 [Pedobacter mendelii]|uniref:Uncharacterized protein n=1 Tax=Pedobacter mendelii TaxID=1908240 RepID=A0ABQ2BDS4_9SPHI|nr:hypothetical protein GCM10008119_08350 [Pedobacter mendelii]